jgi:hypothetical protein
MRKMKSNTPRKTNVHAYREKIETAAEKKEKVRFDKIGQFVYEISLSKVSPRVIAQIAAAFTGQIDPRDRIILAYELLDRAHHSQSFLQEFRNVSDAMDDYSVHLENYLKDTSFSVNNEDISGSERIDFELILNRLFPGKGKKREPKIDCLRLWIEHDYQCKQEEICEILGDWEKNGIPQIDFYKIYTQFTDWHKGYKNFQKKISGASPAKGGKKRGRPKKNPASAPPDNQRDISKPEKKGPRRANLKRDSN